MKDSRLRLQYEIIVLDSVDKMKNNANVVKLSTCVINTVGNAEQV